MLIENCEFINITSKYYLHLFTTFHNESNINYSKKNQMKHLFTTLFAVCLSFTAAVAQEKSDKAPQEKTMSKEEKAAAKAKKEANPIHIHAEEKFSINEYQPL